MNRLFASLWAALIIGLGWSLVLTLALILMPIGIPAHQSFGGALALTGAAIILLAARRQRMPWTTIFFANLILFLFGTMVTTAATSVIGTAAVLGWFRSAGHQPAEKPAMAVAEILSAAGSLALAAVFQPAGVLSTGLGVWIFYLLQIIPMALANDTGRAGKTDPLRSRFEQSRQRVEKIMAARI